MPRDLDLDTLLRGVRAGEHRALAQAISLVESGEGIAADIVRSLYPRMGRAISIGVTGPPGVGKSTLISRLVGIARAGGQTVGVVLVDPSSAFSSGAFLGDRIRLTEHFLDPGVFIRSMATRGHPGGIAEATIQAVTILDAAGKDVVIIETVGIGQAEIDIARLVDTVLLVLMPGSGDAVQALKAGVIEIPDVIAVNKSDHPSASAALNDVRGALDLGPRGDWTPPVVLTNALRGDGVEELAQAIDAHRRHLASGGRLEARRQKGLVAEVLALAAARAKIHLERAVEEDAELGRLLGAVERGELDPVSAAGKILERVFRI